MKIKFYRKLIMSLSFVVVALLISLLYRESCPSGGGLMNFCIFEGRGFPLPYYNLYKIDWSVLLFDFIFWGLVALIICFFIFLFKKLLTIIRKG